MSATKPALPEPVAWLHDVVATDGEPDHALSFAPDNFPLQGVGGFRSIGCQPLYTQAAIDAAVADYAQALSSALGWPGGISDPVLDWPTLLRYVAEARAVPEWRCACDEQGRGEPGVTCGDCPRDYGHCVTPSPTPVEQPKPAVLTAEDAFSLIGVAHWPGMEKGLAASLLPVARKIAEAAGDRGLARRCDELLAALSGEQP